MIVYWGLLFSLVLGLFDPDIVIAQHITSLEASPSSLVYNLPTGVPTFPESAGKAAREACSPKYRMVQNIFNWENINNCFRECIPYKVFDFTTPRGRGHAFYGGSIHRLDSPILFENIHDWKVVNCTGADELMAEGCGPPGGNSTRGLYSSGGAPRNPDIRPRIGSTSFPDSYATFTLNSFKIWTPNLVDNCSQRGCEIHILGYKESGRTVSHTESFSLVDRRTSVIRLGNKGLVSLKAFDIWVTYTKISRSIGQPFIIDDISFDEWVLLPQPPSCLTISISTSSARLTGTCYPRPTATTTFTVDFDDFVFKTTTFIGPPDVPTTTGLYAPTPLPDNRPYKSLYWDSSFMVSTQSAQQGLENVTIPSGSNFVYISGGGPRAVIKANSYSERFGVESLYILCRFPVNADGRPCLVTFYGFRDPYDGSGLPERVSFSLVITDPGPREAGFTFVDFASHTKSPGAFDRLSYFFIVCNVAGDDYRPYILDSIIFTRQLGEGNTCRAPGSIVGSFLVEEGWVIQGEPLEIPLLLGDLRWGRDWVVTGQSLYPPNSLGYNSSTSPPNAIYAIGPDTSIDSYLYPNPPIPLGDFESIDITFDYEEAITNPVLLGNILVEISVRDSCGQSYDFNTASFYNRGFAPGKLQYVFASPMKAITSMAIHAWIIDLDNPSSDRRELRFWADNISFKMSKEELRGCVSCGIRGQQWCEYPGLVRVGEYGPRGLMVG